MKTYLKCLAAYLTGWVIAQSLFNRVRHYVWDRDGYDVKVEIATFVAERLISGLESRDRELAALRDQDRVVRDIVRGPDAHLRVIGVARDAQWYKRLLAAHDRVGMVKVAARGE